MKLRFIGLAFLLCVLNIVSAQNTNDVLLIVDGDSILSSEFLRVYNKNLDLVKDESQKDVDGYLKLFTEYQLKLKEARRLKLHEDSKYQREFLRYKNQLTKNYLSENKATDALVKEAYERGTMDINASHILVRIDQNSQDTVSTYSKVLELRERVLKEGFDAVKADMHNGKTIFLEDLGYFSAFKMVYDFETAAYNTPKGEISMPFRTQFGYHAVMVNDKRPSRGTITAAHIMVGLKQKDSTLDIEARINDIYKKLEQGESFESLAKQFSDDKSSARNGGKLNAFKSGQLSSTTFEDEAFGLTEDGAISQPFKTEYGWHIVKRIALKATPTFEEQKAELESKVQRDSRSKLINAAMVKKLKERYDINYKEEVKSYFKSILNDDYFKRTWALPEDFENEKVVFSINNKDYTFKAFGRHLVSAQRAYTSRRISLEDLVDKEYQKFFESAILKYRENNLENENEDFANILKEYRDGLLLFDLMEKEVWNKASKDSVGLEAYYNQHKSNYQWEDRVELVMASSADKSVAKKVLAMMKKNKSQEEIEAAFNSETKNDVIFTKGIYDITNSKLPKKLKLEKGIDGVYKHNDAFHAINVVDILPMGPKTFEEAKGNVINDYQSQLEKEWIDGLYDRFKINVNDKALKAVKTQIKNQ